MSERYLFTSKRLGFRNWLETDLDAFAEINADPKVMEFYTNILSKEETFTFIKGMWKKFDQRGFCYYAVEKLDTQKLIGFVGMSEKKLEQYPEPIVDIGWRINSNEWNKGYATEGALRCLDYAFTHLQLKDVYSITPKVNLKSEYIMQKIGMKKVGEFHFPAFLNDARLSNCLLYHVSKDQHLK